MDKYGEYSLVNVDYGYTSLQLIIILKFAVFMMIYFSKIFVDVNYLYIFECSIYFIFILQRLSINLLSKSFYRKG